MKGVTKTVKNEVKSHSGGALGMILGTLEAASLLGNLLTGKGTIRAGYGNREGKGTIRASYGNKERKGTIRAGYGNKERIKKSSNSTTPFNKF